MYQMVYLFKKILVQNVGYLFVYSWLSLFWTLNFAQFEQFIQSLGHLALDQSKTTLRILNVKQILRSLDQFSLVIPNVSQNFHNFSPSQISLFFQHLLAQLLQLRRQKWVKTLKSIFLFFFLSNVLIRFFLFPQYLIKLS